PLDDEQHRADAKRHRKDAREQRGAHALPRYRRKRLNMNEKRRAEQQQQRAPHRVVEFHGEMVQRTVSPPHPGPDYFTMPTAFIVAPRSASDFVMNVANSSGGA